MTNKNITLNVWNKNSEKVSVVQGEVDSRFLTVKIMDLTAPLDLTNKTVQFLAKKIDDTVIFNNAQIINAAEGLVQVQLTSQVCAVAGILQGCEFHIVDDFNNTLIVKGIDIEIVASLGEAVQESVSECTAYGNLVTSLDSHKLNISNPHCVTASQIGALPDSTEFGISLSVNCTSLSLKNQNGITLNTVTTQDTTYTAGENISISEDNIISAIDTTYSLATSDYDGLMSKNDKSKLDSIIANTSVNNVQSDWNVSDPEADDYIKNKPAIPNDLTDLTGTLPLANGGTGATEIYNAQKNLGFMKRYTSLEHLTLNDGYTLKDVFLAMADNTFIEFAMSTNMGITIGPTTSGIIKVIRFNRNFGYAEFYGNSVIENSVWFGSLHADRSFTWNKLYTSNKTVPIENGGTGATTAAAALTSLGAAKSADIGNVSSLNTSAKTIVGAINELYSLINN